MESIHPAEIKEDGRVKEFFLHLAADMAEVFWVYSGVPFAKGKRQARRDLNDGKIILKTFGKPAKWRDIYAVMLKESGITLESVSEKMVAAKQREEIRGYNSLVKEAIGKRHGKDFLEMVIERSKDRLLRSADNNTPTQKS